jgi:DNA-binding Lrp family transcriptional regulator
VTLATDQLDRRIIAHLRRVARQNDAAPTVAEITEALTTPMSSIRAALNRLDAAGEIAQIGIAANGARTWAAVPREDA